ncbi:MAG: signal peptide peptidase SppA [Acidobacteria bacterium]|nr:signal peptide peptidase SppA [Acidobacteriota bacterium]
MKKFLLGVVCGGVLAVLAGLVLIFAMVRLADRKPAIADNAVLVLRLDGEIPERAPVDIPLPMFEDQARSTVRDVWSTLKRAADDSRIKAVIVVPRRVDAGWGKIQEIRDSLAGFRKSGKPVYAFLRFPSAKDYYIATAADRIYAGPEDHLDLKGMRVEAMYLRGSLDKIGVSMEVVHAGKYKDAYDMFTRTSMSPETREVMNQVLDTLYSNLVGAIAAGRKKDAAAVRELIDRGPFVASEALKAGLIDKLGYEDDLIADLQGAVKQTSVKKVDAREYLRSIPPDPSRTRIALVVAEGTILQGGGDDGFGSSGMVRSAAFAKLLRSVKSDSTVKGVIVRIDSPGGDAIASDDILHEMKELSKAKPMVISMSDVAASGGYFMAVTGDPIVAYPGTITGSIGVITAKPNLKGLYDKLGVSKDVLMRGRFAGLDSDYKPLSPEEKAKLEESIESTYRGFLNRVATGRRKPQDQIEPLAQGRVWMGVQAKTNGLVDQLGGLDTAIEVLRQKAKIPAEKKLALVPYPPRRSLFELLLSKADDTAMTEAKIGDLLAKVPGGRWLRPALEGGTLALMPYYIEVK